LKRRRRYFAYFYFMPSEHRDNAAWLRHAVIALFDYISPHVDMTTIDFCQARVLRANMPRASRRSQPMLLELTEYFLPGPMSRSALASRRSPIARKLCSLLSVS